MGEDQFIKMRGQNYNENLANIVLNRLSTSKIYDADNKLIQKADPVFMRPGSKYGRAHFFAPYKQIGNLKIGTLMFNIIAIWIMIFFLFVTLYYNILKSFIAFLESLEITNTEKVRKGSFTILGSTIEWALKTNTFRTIFTIN